MRRLGSAAFALAAVILGCSGAIASGAAPVATPPAAHGAATRQAPAAHVSEAPHAADAAKTHHATEAGAGSNVAPLGRTAATLALARLMGGNERYASGRPLHPHQENSLRRRLASGQKPQAIVFSCADSRVPPELVFDHGLGDLFVVRVAGQALDAATVSSIEYAVEHLGAPLLIVMGHQSCGAVKAALTVAPHAAGSDDLDRLLEGIRPGVIAFAAESAKDPLLDHAVRANVDAQLAGLLRRSEVVRERTTSGRLAVVPAVYLMESGRVEFWDAAPQSASAAGAEH